MSKVFEDEFMDFQSGLISLCLEVTKGKVNKIYAYCSNEQKSKMFNAFFEVDGEIKTLSQLGISRELSFKFLKLGTQELAKVNEICRKYSMSAPTEMKICYDVTTGKYKADYKYEEVCSAKTGKGSGEVFTEWLSKMRE